MSRCPKCGAKQFFTFTDSTAVKQTWKECLKCGYKKNIMVDNKKGG